MKEATTIDEQIAILKKRGMEIDYTDEKIKDILLDIGYFRFGFYCFPFEIDYPKKSDRKHVYKEGAKMTDVVSLYYLDVNLRHILIKYINRIEVNFRTKLIYGVSLSYPKTNIWFVDSSIVRESYVDKFNEKVYDDMIRQNQIIKNHHRKYPNDKYAPAWKTMEFMTFGGILTVYRNLKEESVKQRIADCFDIKNILVLENYIETIVKIRNVCAHSAALFDFTLPKSIKKGPALAINRDNNNKLQSAIFVILFMLGKISSNRQNDMKEEIKSLFGQHKDNTAICSIIENCIGYK